jgi:hypothetical protein
MEFKSTQAASAQASNLGVGPLGTPHLNKGKQIVGVSDGEKVILINTNLPAVTVPEPQEYPKAVVVGKDKAGALITKVVHNATEERALPDTQRIGGGSVGTVPEAVSGVVNPPKSGWKPAPPKKA